MIHNQPIMVTLLTGEHPRELPVVAFHGQEAINAPYRFTVDLLIPDPPPELDQSRCGNAYLTLDPHHSIHARITDTCLLHAGNGASLYRINLGPRLLDLHQAPRRRLFQQLSVIQIIELLLREHDMPVQAYRFEPMVGIYPARTLCVQHDETDLHLLQRLCEEEGIHFHFEHSVDMHVLVFADDPACFPARYLSVPFQPPASGAAPGAVMEHLAERWTMQQTPPCHRTMPRTLRKIALAHGSQRRKEASNQHYEACDRSRLPTELQAHDRQRSARTLEQQRCERRIILGRGSELPLTSGQIIQVLDHPEARFNDQWLLVEVDHFGRQPQALLGNDPRDATAILEALESQTGLPADTEPQAGWRAACTIAPFKRGYRNRFRLLPWEMPFRPSLEHHKPLAAGYQPGTLLNATLPDAQRRDPDCLPVSLDGLAEGNEPLEIPAFLAPRQVNRLGHGARVIIGHLDSDPDRPVICAAHPAQEQTERHQEHALSGHQSLPDHSQDYAQHLHSDETLLLSMACGAIEVCGHHIRLTTGHQAPPLHRAASIQSVETDSERHFSHDLRLSTQPGPLGAPLANRIWYIVHMKTPGLEHIARLDPADFLFEGSTDEQGYLGLSSRQLQQLAAAYHNAPDNLCLVHPGCCMTLRAWLAQNGPYQPAAQLSSDGLTGQTPEHD